MATSRAKARATIKKWKTNPVQFAHEVFGFEPDEWQLDALASSVAGDTTHRLMMKACTGPGKAQGVEIITETPTGPRRWGDLKEGDSLFALDGTPTKIVAITWRGKAQMYRVTFDDGTSTTCCEEHLWRTRGRTERRHVKQRSDPEWTDENEEKAIAQGHWRTPEDGWSVLPLAEIIERNESNDGKTRRQFEIPACEAVQYPRKSLPLDPYVLGVWLGDGSRATGAGGWPDVAIDEEISSRGFAVKRNGDCAVTVYGLRTILRQMDVLFDGSPYRSIPEEYFRGSVDQRKDLLAGLMDTDGTIAKDNSVSFDVTSKELAEGVSRLVRSLGGKAHPMRQRQGRYKDEDGEWIECRTCYRVSFAVPFNPFKLPRKGDRWSRPQDRYIHKWIDSIEPVGEQEAMCVQVDNEKSCYLTNDFIVTHNSALLAIIGWHRLTCFADRNEHPKGAALAITKENLSDNLWSEMAKWQSRSEFLKDGFTWTKSTIYAKHHPETWFLSARSFSQDADQEAIGRTLSGLHSRYPFILLDETGDMPRAVGRAAEQIFTGNPADALIAAAGNPTSIDGLLYEVCQRLRTGWEIITITADPDDPKRTPRVSEEHARRQIEQYGRDNPWVMATIMGLFPPGGFNNLLTLDEVEAAIKRFWRPEDYRHAPKIIGVDVAREGDDQSVIFRRQGKTSWEPRSFRNAKSTDLAGWVAQIEDDWQADGVIIDGTGGYGAGVIDVLEQSNRKPHDCQFAAKADKPHRYYNKRTEMYFRLAEWVKDGGSLPDVPELMEELTSLTYGFKGDRVLLEPKEALKARIGRSPDFADALAVTFAFRITPKEKVLPRSLQYSNEAEDWSPFDAL